MVFSLITEPFVPVRPRDGGPIREVGLLELLTQAHDFERIDDPSPLITVALYRLCLAILHRALSGPADAAQAAQWYAGGFPVGRIEAYFERYAERFDLFHPKTPFMQVPDLTLTLESGKYSSHWTRLGAEVGSANTTALFNPAARPGGERQDAISPAQAVKRLLEHQTFALGGLIKRFTTSARAAPVATLALTVAEGRTLHETLCLNLVPYLPGNDLPTWERPPLNAAHIQALYDPEKARMAAGLTDHYSWLSRSIRLEPELDEQGQTVVRFIGFAAGVPFKNTLDTTGTTIDPMVATVASRDPQRAFPFAQKLRREQLFWRDVLALLPEPQNKQQATETRAAVKVSPAKGRPPQVVVHALQVIQELKGAPGIPLPGGNVFASDTLLLKGHQTTSEKNYQAALPVSIFGQITDQGKAFAFRQEGYTLPNAYLQDAQKFTDEVSTALETAKRVGEGLKLAIRCLVTETLPRGGEREAHKDQVTKLISQLPAEANFWVRLETPFRQYLAEWDGSAHATATWNRTLLHTAWTVWELALMGVGKGSAALRAASKAVNILLAVLQPLQSPPAESSPQTH